MINSRTKTTYYYCIKEISLEQFESKNDFSEFCKIYQKIFLEKATAAIDKLSDSDILNIQNCNHAPLNRKITSHVLKAQKKCGSKFCLSQFFDFFRITWKVKLESANQLEA